MGRVRLVYSTFDHFPPPFFYKSGRILRFIQGKEKTILFFHSYLLIRFHASETYTRVQVKLTRVLLPEHTDTLSMPF